VQPVKERYSMQYVRVYADSAGESHFADVEIDLTPVAMTSSAPPLQLSSFMPATECSFMRVPAGWQRTWRPTPRRELFFCLSGEIESEVSDGEVRRFGPGSIMLSDDATGKGHTSRSVGTDAALFGVVQLPEEGARPESAPSAARDTRP
jgi:hypothetical protein